MKAGVFFVALTGLVGPVRGEAAESLAARIEKVMARPEYRHSTFGVEIYSLAEKRTLYAHNQDRLFVPGSVTKLMTEGTVLHLLGPDHRFRTRIYRTGTVSKGVLDGDLVLVASGDPNLSNRVQPDDTLAFEDEDHAYGQVMEARLLPGDPLQVIRALAAQVAAKGVRKIAGQVLVDTSLFPEGGKEGGTGVVISPIAVNDNVIDVVVTPGKSPGEPATVAAVPATTYATLESRVETLPAGGEVDISFSVDSAAGGPLTVKVLGTVVAGEDPRPFPFAIPEPSRFAREVLVDALRRAGVEVAAGTSGAPDWPALARAYTPENQVAEHVSPPLEQDVKVTLKVSQNLHAATMPYVLGATLGRAGEDALSEGFAQERAFLEKAGLDMTAAAQSDGAGGDALFTPDFVVRFLAFMAAQKEGNVFREALPTLGRDGTLARTGRDSVAAGRLRAKTGTHVKGDLLNGQLLVHGKGLAGYLEAADGSRLIIAAFVNNVPAGTDMKSVMAVGDALAEIAAAAYDAR